MSERFASCSCKRNQFQFSVTILNLCMCQLPDVPHLFADLRICKSEHLLNSSASGAVKCHQLIFFHNWVYFTFYRYLLLLHLTSRQSHHRCLRPWAVPAQAWPAARSHQLPRLCWFPRCPPWVQSAPGTRSRSLQSSKALLPQASR